MSDAERSGSPAPAAESIYDLAVTTIEGVATTLAPYRGRVLLVVNVASECGLTPQYAALEALHRAHGARGLTVLGFPCDQFGGQEPGDERTIAQFCERNYGVTFPLFAKVDVNGPRAHPLFRLLKRARPGVFGSRSIKWNFTKFLIDRSGRAVKRFAPNDPPELIEPDIVRLLA